MDAVIRILAIGLAFGLTVFVHELGHFLSARLAGMVVYEFSIGFGRPLLFWFKRGDTQYSFRLWPFFSYVRIAGMEADDDHPQGFGKKRRSAQAIVLCMGSVMNFLLAVGIFVVMGTTIGRAVSENRIDQVMDKSPAKEAGLLAGDWIVGANGKATRSVATIREVITGSPGKLVVLDIERGGKRQAVPITPRAETEYDVRGLKARKVSVGRIGIVFAYHLQPMGVGESVKDGFLFIYDMVHVQIAGLVGMLQKTVPAEFIGPVGMAGMLYSQAKAGWSGFLWTFALFTTAICFLNLLPIPPLDGSRLAILAVEGIRGKPFDQKKVFVLHLVGLALFLGLAVIIAYKDIIRLLAQKSP